MSRPCKHATVLVPVCEPCETVRAGRREYARDYARRRRDRRLAALNRGASTCQKKIGRHGVCGGRIDADVINGRTVLSCVRCDRVARGFCIECPARVDGMVGKARRCSTHARLAKQAQYEKYKKGHRRELALKARRRYRTDAADRTRRNEYKKLWRKANPGRVARGKRASYERRREHALEYHRQYRAAKRAERAAVELSRYHGTLPPRTCLTCPAILTGRAKKCDACRQAARQAARAEITRRVQASPLHSGVAA